MAGFKQREDLIPQFDVEDPNVVAPRPDAVGTAPPRPTAPNAFIRPSDRAAETLRKFKAVQEAGTKRKRAEVRKSFEGPTTAEQEAIDARNLEKQQQLQARVDIAGAPAKIKAAGEVEVAGIEAGVERFKAQSLADTAKTQQELEERIANIEAGADVVISENDIRQSQIDATSAREVAENKCRIRSCSSGN